LNEEREDSDGHNRTSERDRQREGTRIIRELKQSGERGGGRERGEGKEGVVKDARTERMEKAARSRGAQSTKVDEGILSWEVSW